MTAVDGLGGIAPILSTILPWAQHQKPSTSGEEMGGFMHETLSSLLIADVPRKPEYK